MASVQERKYDHVRTYGQDIERLFTHTYGQGSCTWLGRNRETVSSSCSWGGNGMRRVHREATERVGANRLGLERNAWSCSSGGLGRNRRWKRGLAYRRTEETALCSTGHVQNGILFIGRGMAY